MNPVLLLMVCCLLGPLPALAQPGAFSCVGAEGLEADVFSISFQSGSSTIPEAARSPLAAAIEAALSEPERNICILGHAGQEGGARTSIQLAAQRARAVRNAMVGQGVGENRLRAEARSAQFSPMIRALDPPSRTVTIVLMPGP